MDKNYRSDPFYHTAVWQKAREAALIRDHYLCQRCLAGRRLTAANTVHHIKHLDKHPDLALDPDNLVSLCERCHARAHAGAKKDRKVKRRARIIKG